MSERSDNKDPAFLFYTADFLVGTALLTDEQVGQYVRLLCFQHQKGHLREKDILKICRERDEDILCKFIIDEKGLYYNRRLESEITKRAAHSKKQRENIDKRWKKEVDNIPNSYQSDTNSLPQQGNTMVLPLENENENVTTNDFVVKEMIKGSGEKEEKKNSFDVFWAAYPKKKSKGKAEEVWKSIKPGSELISTILKQLEKAKTCNDWLKDGGQFIPYPATWLRAKGWEDEYVIDAALKLQKKTDSQPKKTKFNNFEQRDTNYNDLEDAYFEDILNGTTVQE